MSSLPIQAMWLLPVTVYFRLRNTRVHTLYKMDADGDFAGAARAGAR